MNASVNVNAVIDAVPTRKVPGAVTAASLAAVVVGLAAFAFGLVTDPVWAWGAVLVGVVYTLGLSLGGVMFAVISTLTWARWSRPLNRVAEAFALFLPFAYVALAIFLIAGNRLYPWNPATFVEGGPVSLEPHSEAVRFISKPIWLTTGFFIGRQLVGVGILLVFTLAYVRNSLRPDLMAARVRLEKSHPDYRIPGWWRRIIGNATGDPAIEAEKTDLKNKTLGVLLGVTYAFVMSLVAFDLIMSLAPEWVSNLFGAWFFTSSFWLAMQGIGLYALASRDWLGLSDWVRPKNMHDLGMLILAYTMAWAYMLFGQVLPIWYTNMPEETQFLLVRLMLPKWAWLTQTVVVLCFLMPFTVLTSRGIKKMRWPFAALLATMMIGVFLERTMLVMPSVYHGDAFPVHLFAIVSVGVWVGFLGAFVLVITNVLARVPSLPVSDPKLALHPWDEHAHALHGAP